MVEINEKVVIDGKETGIISGSIHYFRVVPEYWQDRLEKLKNMGCNTVETYIPWNFHEEKKGQFNWKGGHDVFKFIELASKLGLYVIIRPSPYICAEWEFGGLPYWLLKERGMRLRCSYKPYLDAIKSYYEELIPRLVPYQHDKGGNIILFQIENEYGYYGTDHEYMKFLADTMRSLGVTQPFVTSDGPWVEASFKNGMVKGAWATGNFGSQVETQFNTMEKYVGGNKAKMCMEFWCGWFDAWGEPHHTSDLEQNKKDLADVIKTGHVNFYMFEGGTNFGYTAGRNFGVKNADITSYDYDAILTEDGQITPKYEAFKKIISESRKIEEVPLSTKICRKAYGELKCTGRADLFTVLDDISTKISSPYPLTMEDIDQSGGYILYRTRLPEYEKARSIKFDRAGDRVNVFENQKPLFAVALEEMKEAFKREDAPAGSVVDMLFENYGRVNFGPALETQRKGIEGYMILNDHLQHGYDIYSLPLDEKQLSKIDFAKGFNEGCPAFYKYEFEADELCDTFLEAKGFEKGVAFVNGFNLGRYWNIGPQKRLYIPAPLLKKGKNTIIIFDTEGKEGTVSLEDSLIW
ncbi:beta-galactosidase family protein [Treponema sp.]|uniref:glycoside hydrolase family 35 protein n=1 Tax=Treponema sp. TaxID=166 RepID=UPI00257F75D0|nr:beta-galactosidase family protein [Treponema sp.]